MSKHNKKDWHKFKEEMEQSEGMIENEEETGEGSSGESTQEGVALDHPSYIHLEEQLTLAEQKAHENWEKSVRAVAELDNVRRRMEREVANAHKYGMEKLITALLPVIDSLEQALQIAEKSDDVAMHEGLDLTMKLFTDVLQKFDVARIDPVGEVFDPQQHEAMSIQEVPGTPPNTVVTVFQKGYKLSDRVIRPARVIVSKNKPAEG
ncbi:nucleotide exchange factor GrpE [Legionella fallonii]|uniref:Protein GrpE n=1 Tax=Legionella fallonii LLAP-10 TaxID=1212491 RepID=A0A098G6L2_9GAMM|nr:nucleotide exchange factor GrpE [Legionella fallonii]CEG57604.1 Protein GrpE [Legionella fallonii LLAP-10]